MNGGPGSEALEREIPLTGGADPLMTLAVLWQGPGDPQMRWATGAVMRAMRLPSGPASVHLSVSRTAVVARAWGAGAQEALDIVPGLIGERDDPGALVVRHRLIADLVRRMPGLRLTRDVPLFEALVPSIMGQKVTSLEARRAHRGLLVQHGESAPGPLGLRLPPPPEKLALMPYWAFHPLGLERRRADTIRAAAAAAPGLGRITALSGAEAGRRLLSVPGVGPWTAAETVRLVLGDPDAVSLGDFHLPRLVGWLLARERDTDDSRMLELLEPYRGQRARVVLLLEHSGVRVARRGPRLAPRSIASI